jgi:hypothetical protein
LGKRDLHILCPRLCKNKSNIFQIRCYYGRWSWQEEYVVKRTSTYVFQGTIFALTVNEHVQQPCHKSNMVIQSSTSLGIGLSCSTRLIIVKVNFMCQIDWATRCPYIWINMTELEGTQIFWPASLWTGTTLLFSGSLACQLKMFGLLNFYNHITQFLIISLLSQLPSL